MHFKRLLAIIGFLFCILVANAQDSRSHNKPVESPFSNLKVQLSSQSDTLKKKLAQFNGLQGDSLPLLRKADSLKNAALSFQHDALDSAQQKIRGGTATVGSIVANQTDSVRAKLRSNAESISHLSDSLTTCVAGIQENLQEKTNAVIFSAKDKTSNIISKPQDNLSAPMKELGLEQVKFPNSDLNLPNANMTSWNDLKISDQNVNPNTDIGVNTPTLQQPKTIELKKESSKIELDAGNVQEKLKAEIPGAERIEELSNKVTEIKAGLPDLQKSAEILNKVKNGEALPEAEKQLESAVTEVSEVKELTGQMDKITKQQQEYQAMLQKYRDKKLEKEELLRKAKGIANEKLNKYSPDVTKVTDKLNKARRVRSLAERLKSLNFKNSSNTMKGRPFYERIVPGVSFQAINTGVYNLDVNPRIGFKLSGTFLVGAEGCYRFAFNRDFKHWVETPGVYGYRFYSHINLHKGTYLHTEFERLQYEYFANEKLKLEQFSQQVTNFNFGLGKKYAISSKINGTMVVFYRAEINGHVPSVNKIFVRVGFDLNTKKKRQLGLK
jgi:hypothetical protein